MVVLDKIDPRIAPEMPRDVAFEEASHRRARPRVRDAAKQMLDEECAWNSFYAELCNLPLARELLFADIQQVIAGLADGSMICLIDVAARKIGRAIVAVHAHDSASHRPQHAPAERPARGISDWHVLEGDEDRVLDCAAQAGVIAYVVTDAQGDTAQGSQEVIDRIMIRRPMNTVMIRRPMNTVHFPNRDIDGDLFPRHAFLDSIRIAGDHDAVVHGDEELHAHVHFCPFHWEHIQLPEDLAARFCVCHCEAETPLLFVQSYMFPPDSVETPPPSQVPCKRLLQRTELVDEAFQAPADHAAQAQVLGAHVRKHELSHVGVVEDFA
jgi:hypothetical protein